MQNRYFAYLFLFLSLNAFAQDDQVTIVGGPKNLSFGLQEDLWDPIKQKATVGYWSNREFVAGQIGFEISGDTLVGNTFYGPYLGTDGRIMPMIDAGLGLRDDNFNYIGLMYRQMAPNNDIIGVEIKFSLSR